MIEISPERKLRFLSKYMDEWIDLWPKKPKPFPRWLESTLDRKVHKGKKEAENRKKLVCAYCRRKFDENVIDKTKDHIIPLSRGGFDRKENRVPCCHTCNQWKSDKLLPDWLTEIRKWHSGKKEHDIYDKNELALMRYNIEKLIDYVRANNKKISNYRL